MPGRYFLKIIGVLCAELQMETSNFQPFCVEDPSRNQLTLSGACIHAPATTTSTAVIIDILNSSIIGHWWYNTNETQTPFTQDTNLQIVGVRVVARYIAGSAFRHI